MMILESGSIIPKQNKTTEIALLLLVYVLSIAFASVLWKHPMVLIGCYIIISVLALLKWHARADVIAYAATAVLGCLGEGVAVKSGAWTYTKSQLLIPVWVPLLWGIVGFFVRRLTWTLTSPHESRK